MADGLLGRSGGEPVGPIRVLMAAALVASVVVLGEGPAGADPGSVVINEIHYNPAGDIDDHEFVELHNPGTTAVDLTGYTIGPVADPAFNLVAPLTGMLNPGEYVILGPDGADTVGQWGVAPIATYTGKVSNGGETIELLDASANVVDAVTYDDKTPWPVSPDGGGPSLELIDPNSDNTIATSWAASVAAPTPGAENSVFSNPPAAPIADIAISPSEPAPGQAVTVSATIVGGSSPDLVYVVDFGSETTLAMTNVGGDTYSATIPAQAAGELVRYKIDAPAAGTQAPTADDGRRYFGYVVDDPSVVTNASLIEWFIPEADYDSMFDDPTQEVDVSGSVMAINGVVYDNISVRIRGGSFARNNLDKQGLSIDLPDGVTVSDAALVPYAIDEFALSSQRGGWFPSALLSSWRIMEEAGFPVVNGQDVRVERNGEFYGIYRFSEKLDGTWRSENNIDGEFWKVVTPGFNNLSAGFEQKQPDDEDLQPILDLAAVLDMPASAAKTAALYEIMDIPSAVNWMASIYAIGHVDSAVQNFYLERNTDGRWMIYPWDLTNTFGVGTGNCDGTQVDLTCADNPLWNSLREIPEVEDMLWRRLRTLVDGPMADGVLEGQYTTYYSTISVLEQQLDDQAWTAARVWKTPTEVDTGRIDTRRNAIIADAKFPAAPSGSPNVVINEIHYNPADGGVEFVELFNPSTESIDLSKWELAGVGLDFPGGTVILPGAYVVATADVGDFSELYTSLPNTVLVEFSGGVSNGGEKLELFDADGVLIDEVEYADGGDWVSEPDGSGPSLVLVDPASNNNDAASWLISSSTGGSPGEVNDPIAPSIDRATVLASPCTIYDTVAGSAPHDAALNGGESRVIQATGALPSSQGGSASCVPDDATAVVVSVQAEGPVRAGNLRLIPTGGVINGGVVNYAPNGLDNTNTVTVPVAADGSLELSANSAAADDGLASTDVVLRAVAYYSPSGELVYTPVTPCTAHDTRPPLNTANPGPFTGSQNFTVDVKGNLPSGVGGQASCGVPDSAEAVLVNVVALNPTGTGELAIGDTVTTFADLGMNNAAATIVPQDGVDTFTLAMEAPSATVNFRVVVLGFFDDVGGSDFVAVSPCVAFDSRPNQGPAGPFAGLRDGGQSTTYGVTGSIPAAQGGGGGDCGVPDGATGVLINLVALNPAAEGNLQAFATGTTPSGGVLNFANLDPAMNNANAVPVPLSAGGTLDVFVNTGPTDISDAVNVRGVILGYYIDAA